MVRLVRVDVGIIKCSNETEYVFFGILLVAGRENC
jgi:hypothetical protein